MNKPVLVYFNDRDSAKIYELTRSQFGRLEQADDWDTIEKFEIKPDNTIWDGGYAPDIIMRLAEIYGFEVESI